MIPIQASELRKAALIYNSNNNLDRKRNDALLKYILEDIGYKETKLKDWFGGLLQPITTMIPRNCGYYKTDQMQIGMCINLDKKIPDNYYFPDEAAITSMGNFAITDLLKNKNIQITFSPHSLCEIFQYEKIKNAMGHELFHAYSWMNNYLNKVEEVFNYKKIEVNVNYEVDANEIFAHYRSQLFWENEIKKYNETSVDYDEIRCQSQFHHEEQKKYLLLFKSEYKRQTGFNNPPVIQIFSEMVDLYGGAHTDAPNYYLNFEPVIEELSSIIKKLIGINLPSKEK